eukprot:COSAG05_NODE_272_length_12454_cov_1460.218085_10_plen_213_part_00
MRPRRCTAAGYGLYVIPAARGRRPATPAAAHPVNLNNSCTARKPAAEQASGPRMIGLSLSARLVLDACHAVSAARWLPRQWRCAWVDRLPAWLDRWRTRSRAHSADSRVRGWMRFPRGSVLFPCDLLHASVTCCMRLWLRASLAVPGLAAAVDCQYLVMSATTARASSFRIPALACIYVTEDSLGGSGLANAHVALSLSSSKRVKPLIRRSS